MTPESNIPDLKEHLETLIREEALSAQERIDKAAEEALALLETARQDAVTLLENARLKALALLEEKNDAPEE